ncbi:MAG TPA: hypothetical protein VGM55_06550, partial [Cedecea sp.]
NHPVFSCFALIARLAERLLPAAHLNLSSHPVFRMPPAATSWASCLDDALLRYVFVVKLISWFHVNTSCVGF